MIKLCQSIGKYTPIGIRGTVAPKSAPDANTVMYIVKTRCTAAKFQAKNVEKPAISTSQSNANATKVG